MQNLTEGYVKEVIIWPEYFKRELSRRLGRRVPLSLALEKVDPKDLELACRNIDPECEVEIIEGKKYPRVWYVSNGWYAIVRLKKDISKNILVKKIAEVLLKLRS